MIKQNQTINTTYRTDIIDITIRYSVNQNGNAPVESVNANIQKQDNRIGTANIDRDGSTGISLMKGLTVEERVSILTSVIQDTDEIFNPKSE